MSRKLAFDFDLYELICHVNVDTFYMFNFKINCFCYIIVRIYLI